MTIRRKVRFYYLNIERAVYTKENNKTTIQHLSATKKFELFQQTINQNAQQLSNGNFVFRTQATNGREYVIEVINVTEQKAFIKIGQQNYANTIALRDKHTSESEQVPMLPSQLLELFTYCLIDFETGIVSYINLHGTPNVSVLCNIFNDFYTASDFHAYLSTIISNDILDLISKKQVISSIDIDVAVPNDEILSGVIGLNEDDFDSLRDVPSKTISLHISKRANIFKNRNAFLDFINKVLSKNKDSLKSIKVRAKDSGEKSEVYNLFKYCFTKDVELEDLNTNFREEDFAKQLEDVYQNNKEDIKQYIRYPYKEKKDI
ncbi:MAG: hypothetical protein NC084_06165 [Bacteroides sp.]|nr:hypothetical protein [Eubacterium sp.]MCM1418190.1 hypothetical protein [Roseburia sp.]MCM1462285.1 hypothetical protein [Bacteroides sp.]